MLDPSTLDDLMRDGTGRKDRNPWVGLGRFEITCKSLRKKLGKKQVQMLQIGGKLTAVEVEPLEAYILEARVDASTNPKHKVGSTLAVWFRMNETKPHYKLNDDKDLFEFIQKFYAGLGVNVVVGGLPEGADAAANVVHTEMRATALAYINALLESEASCKGGKLILETRMPKATDKEGKPKAKPPTEDGFLFKSWQSVKQSAEEFQASAAAIDAA